MVYTRRQNAKADANPSKPVFSKKQNDLFIQKDQEYSLYAKVEIFNLFVPGLNESSTEADMKTAYCSMALRFHPDKNIDVDPSKMMGMISEAKEGLKKNCIIMMQSGKKKCPHDRGDDYNFV